MVSSPLLVGFVVRVSGTATADLNATCRNETTDQATTKTTGSDGKVIFNLGSTVDFSKGWNVSAKVSVVVSYRAFEQTFGFTIPAVNVDITIRDRSGNTVGTFKGGSGMDGALDLVAVAELPSLRYFTSQEFLDYLNMVDTNTDAENGIDFLQLTRIGEQVEQGIDSETNTKFDNNSGSFYKPSDIEGGENPEFHDVKYSAQSTYFTRFKPINSVSTFAKNNNGEGQSTDFETLTEANNDIAIDKATGRIKIIDSGEIPEIGIRHVKITYTFGRATTPNDIKHLAIVETARRMMGAAFLKSRIKKLDDVTLTDLDEFMSFRTRIIRKYKNHTFLSS